MSVKATHVSAEQLAKMVAAHSPENPLVNELAQLLREVREGALEARACIAAVPEVTAMYERQIASSVQAEEQLLAAIRAISPKDADVLSVAPVGQTKHGVERLALRLSGSEMVRKITRGEASLRPRPPAPPVSCVAQPLTAQELEEFRSK